MLKSDITLMRVDPTLFSFRLAEAKDASVQRTDIQTLVKRTGGIAGINTNFFDESGNPLGLVVRDAEQEQKIQTGGNLLTGVFYVANDKPAIAHRNVYSPDGVTLAFQAGPRLIDNGEPLKLSPFDGPTRRSGIAVTNDGYVILYATVVRFPGATLEQIQEMLLRPELKVRDALNLDGGGSSQFYVRQVGSLSEEIFLTGGDLIPVGLVIKPKPVKH